MMSTSKFWGGCESLEFTCLNRYSAATGDDQQKSREVLLDGVCVCLLT